MDDSSLSKITERRDGGRDKDKEEGRKEGEGGKKGLGSEGGRNHIAVE